MTETTEDKYPPQLWRVRFKAKDGRMTTVYLPVESNLSAKVIETPALRIHVPDWIGQNFVTLTGKLFREQGMMLSCRLVTEMEVDWDSPPDSVTHNVTQIDAKES